jgi:hypothetical protein
MLYERDRRVMVVMRQCRATSCRSLVGGKVGESKRDEHLFYCDGYPVSLSARSLIRAEGRASRGSSLRNPVHALLNGIEYLFTQAEWERAEESGKRLSRSIDRNRREEVEEKVKFCLKLARQRNTRLIMAAGRAAGESAAS